MKKITIKEAFVGYAHGAHEGSKSQSFKTGQEMEVSDEFAELIVSKGLAAVRDVQLQHEPAHAELRARKLKNL